jgi:thioredoxin 2
MSEIIRVPCATCGTANRIPADRLGDRPVCGRCKGPVFSGRPVSVAEADFDRQVLASGLPVVVDFWAPWCGPCRAMAPAFEAAATRLEPQLRCVKVDTDAAPTIAARYAIRSIPTLMLFRGGKVIARHAGALGRDQIEAWVAAALDDRAPARSSG